MESYNIRSSVPCLLSALVKHQIPPAGMGLLAFHTTTRSIDY